MNQNFNCQPEPVEGGPFSSSPGFNKLNLTHLQFLKKVYQYCFFNINEQKIELSA